MKKYTKICISLILSVLFILSFGTAVFAEGEAKQDWENRMNGKIENTKDIYTDSNGNMYYLTSDTKATTEITYKTEQIVISDANNPSNGYLVDIAKTLPMTIPVPNAAGTGFIMVGAHLIGNMVEVGQKLGSMNIRMDCVMQTYQKGVADGTLYTDASLINLVASLTGVSLKNMGTSEQLLTAYGWIDKSGILSHFDWRLKLLDLGFSDKQVDELLEQEILEDPENGGSSIVDSRERENVVAMHTGADHDETPEAKYSTGTESVGNDLVDINPTIIRIFMR